jgi:hypothetical protein
MTVDLSLPVLSRGLFDFDLHLFGEEPAAMVSVQTHFDPCSFGRDALQTGRIGDIGGFRRCPDE